MSHYEPSVTLHQQDGGMTVQAFADQQGIPLKMLRYYIKTGRVVGARQDSRSKKWTIYPPAKLTVTPRSRERLEAAGFDVGTSPHGLSVELAQMHQGEHGGSNNSDPCKLVLTLPDAGREGKLLFAAALPGAARSLRVRQPASCGKPDVYTEARSICRTLHDAALKQYREGIHYLRLNAREFAQLYAALDNDRSRVRKMVGKGVLPVGLLRASDSVWHKMQAMSREGKLL